jgi:hypothetical protein
MAGDGCEVASLCSALYYSLKVICVNVHPRPDHEGPEGSRDTAFLFLYPWCFMWVDGQGHAWTTSSQGGRLYLLCRRLGGLKGWSGRVWNISSCTGIQSLVHPTHLFYVHEVVVLRSVAEVLGMKCH